MKNSYTTFTKLLFTFFLLLFVFTHAQEEQDSLAYPIKNRTGGLVLDNQVEYKTVYDAEIDRYVLTPYIGEIQFGEPIVMKREQYLDLLMKQSMNEDFREKSREYDQLYKERRDGLKGALDNLLPSLEVKSKAFETIFGGSKIELIPQGRAAFDLAALIQNIENPQLLPQNRNNFTLDLQQRIQVGLLGKVGENLNLNLNYDTQAGFAFENRLNLAWKPNAEGGEDNIIQNIEFGNISMPLNTSLIQGAQSLFGVRTDLKFGKTYVSTVFSEQQSEARTIQARGGDLVNTFKVFAENYQYNQHFFLGQYFRNTYNTAVGNYPLINSTTNISRIEVWRIDRSAGNQQNRRSILAVRDIGENAGNAAVSPRNGALYEDIASQANIRDVSAARNIMETYTDPTTGEAFQDGEHYVINENARKLNPTEYTIYPQLGYISLNQPITDGEDLLAISIQYTQNGQVQKVGEVSDEQEELLVVKLLKPNNAVNTASPMWDLMMKNIYSLDNATNVSQEEFLMQVLFKDLGENASGTVNYLPGTNLQDRNLLQVTNIDRLDQNGNQQTGASGAGDGIFDFVPNITINPQNGTVIFTQVEPFGDDLRAQIDPAQADEFVFDAMYDNIPGNVFGERLSQRYSLEGRFKAQTGGGIPLGAFNVPQGSVTVTANGQELMEGVDYTVDYQLGRVNVINQEIINSGVPVNISLENNSTFNLQKKRFFGVNVEHRFSDKFIIGGTALNYQERPLTQKALFGVEPVNNTMLGVNAQYQGDSEFLTRLTNKIPGIKTDATSGINFRAEGAYLMAGTNPAVNGESYIDDFEDSQTQISLLDPNAWRLGSTPGSPAGVNGPHPLFPNGNLNDDLSYGNGRRLMSWYQIDPRFYGIGGNTAVSDGALSNHRSRRVELRELFDQRDVLAGTAAYLPTLDVTFYPEERGPYNVNPAAGDTENWGSMMRPLNVSNFINANVEYLEFWMMDPYSDGTGGDGKLIFQIGNVSEDILKDGELQFENGLPTTAQPDVQTSTSNWGVQPDNYPIVYAFDTQGDLRRQQDVGYDGLSSADEALEFNLNETNPISGQLDPAADDYLFYLSSIWDGNPLGDSLTTRYRYFRNPENNSPEGSLEAETAIPNAEDINNDYNLDQTELYTQYTVALSQAQLNNPANRLIVSRKDVDVTFENGQTGSTTWYQFRIPVDEFDIDLDGDGSVDVANPQNLRSVLTNARFMRVVMQDFQQETTLRFGTLDLVRSDWRRFPKNIAPEAGEEATMDVDISNVEIGTVDIETNSTRTPPYVLPPGIRREQLQGTTGFQAENESSMVIRADLGRQQARGVFRNVNLDMRRYKRMQMFVHAEDLNNPANQELDEDTRVFIRMGSDYSDNYYEYEIPLKYTPASANTAFEIWPDENEMDFLTEGFVDAKLLRDEDSFDVRTRFEYLPDDTDPTKRVYVKGRPSLGNVTSLMIGVRTANQTRNVEVWVNELRLSEIDNQGGYAATANLGFNLGDFAQVDATGSFSSVGFGPIDLGPSERAQEEVKNYNVNAQVQLHKFLPEEWGVQLPVSVNFAEEFIDPKFNPLDNDVEFENAPNRNELQKIIRTYTKTKSIAFTNIRKNKVGNKPKRFYDISNFSFSFLYADDYFRDIYTNYNIQKRINASANYSHSFKPKTIQPFKDWRMVADTAKSLQYLRWVKEFNFNLLPSRISFRSDVVRTYNELQYRDINSFLGGTPVQFNPIFSSNFLMSWQYNVGFDLTRSLKLDFNSSTRTLNDSPEFLQLDRQLVWQNLFSVGRPVNYDQQVRLNWRTPLSLLPFLGWTNAEMSYSTQYNWQANSRVLTDSDLGNNAQNLSTFTATGTLDFNKLFSDWKPFAKMDSIRQGRKRELDSLNTSLEGLSKKTRRKKKRFKFKNKYRFSDYFVMALTSVKQAQLNLNRTEGAMLPGILAEPNFFGVGNDGTAAPGLGFIFGTEFDIRSRVIQEGWISDNPLLITPYQYTKTSDFNYQVQIQPSANWTITLNGIRNKTQRDLQSNYNLLDVVPDDPSNPLSIGNQSPFLESSETLNMSMFTARTSFADPDAIYTTFLENAQVISERLGTTNANSSGLNGATGYFDGYGIGNADVLIPAFIATMNGANADGTKLSYKRNIPLPNWQLSYRGLTGIPWFAKRFTNFEISHAYSSVYTAADVRSNINFYNAQVDSNFGDRDGNQNFYASNTYGSVNVVESFAPLVGVDMTFRNNLQLRAQYNRNRLISLSLANYTMNEQYGNELIAGLGYVFKDLKVKMRYRGKKKTIKGDLNIRADLRITDNETRLRRLLENDSQLIGGQRQFSLIFNADYDLSRNFNLRFFYEHNATNYKISTAFPITTVRSGLSATFTFGN